MSAPWSQPAVVIVTGIHAAGKSTVGRLLAERGALVEGDVLSRMVVSGGAGMTPDPSHDAVLQLHLRLGRRRCSPTPSTPAASPQCWPTTSTARTWPARWIACARAH